MDGITTNKLLENESILVELKKAWIDSEPDISGGHEEGGFFLGELVISEQNIYLIEPEGDYHVVGATKIILER